MRTTLDIDDDVLAATKEVARRQNLTAGQLVSRLLRQSLTGAPAAERASKGAARRNAAGFSPLPSRGKVVNNGLVNTLRDTEGV